MRILRADIESVGERVFDAYSRLPEVADSDICRVEPELLIKRMLGLSLDYQYLSPDESILGVTSFEPIVITVFDICNRPFFYQMDGKTILIDSLLRYEATQRGRCNYTMMHEVSHQILKMMFPKEYSAMSAKNKDDHNRLRSRTIGFRVSPEEDKINMIVSLTGMKKQDYIVAKLLDRTVNVQGNCKVHRAVYDRLTDVLTELRCVDTGGNIDDELRSDIELLAEIVDRLYVKNVI